MICPKCQQSIPKGTPAEVGDECAGETEITVQCRCGLRLYAFVPTWTREDYALQIVNKTRRKK